MLTMLTAGEDMAIRLQVSLVASPALPEYLRISQMPSTIGHKVHPSDMTRNINSHNNKSTAATPMTETENRGQHTENVLENSTKCMYICSNVKYNFGEYIICQTDVGGKNLEH